MNVQQIMYKRLLTVPHDATATDVAKFMAKKHLGYALVEQQKKIVGIVTERDFITKLIAKNLDPDTILIAELMSSPIIMVRNIAPIEEASALMLRYNIRQVVVMERNKPCGIVSTSLIGKYMAQMLRQYRTTT